MVTSFSLPLDIPRISSNQLGEYPFASEAKRVRILRDMKFGNEHRAPYYQSAWHSTMGSFIPESGSFSLDLIYKELERLALIEPRNRNHGIRIANNLEMIRRFSAVANQVRPPTGRHTIIQRNATMEVEGVLISVRPEIITHCDRTGLMSFTKFRFSKSKVSADASEIILLLLLRYAHQPKFDGAQLDLERTILLDCYSGLALPGHQLHRLRQAQLDAALADIRRQWPKITPDT